MSDQKIKTAAGKPALNLVPLRALKGASRVFTYGGKKYAVGNFLKAAMEDGAGGRYIGAELRHMSDLQGLDGQFTPESLAGLDPESGLPHIDHMLCGLIMLRSIMIKDGVLAEDPGEGLEPPVLHQALPTERLVAEVRVRQGNFDVVPFGGEYGGCPTNMAAEDAARAVTGASATFKGREPDEYGAYLDGLGSGAV